jgi:uncharacterized protein YcbK (DUF882 family)
MAKFNEDPGVAKAPNFAIREEPMRKPFLDLSKPFAALGDMFETITTIKDNNNQRAIEERVRTEAETSNDIVTDGQYSAVTAQNAPAESDVGAPPELEKSFKRLDVLQSAYKQGKVNEAAYWGRLNAVAKELRVKYPGYDSIIDSKFSSITGRIPGNALRDQLIRDAEAAAKASGDATKAQEADIDRWGSDGVLPSNWRELYSKGQFDLIRDYAFRSYENKIVTERRLKNIELREKEGEAEDGAAYKLARTNLQKSFDGDVIHTMKSVSPGGWQGFAKMVAGAKAEGSPGGSTVTNEEMAQITGLLTQFELNQKQKFEDQLNMVNGTGPNARPFRNYLKPAQIEELRKEWDNRTTMYKDLVTNKEYGLLSWNKTLLENAENGDTLSVIEKDEFLRKVNILRQVGGSEAVNTLLQTELHKLKKSVDGMKVGKVVTDVVTGNKPLVDSLTESKPGGTATGIVVESVRKIVTDPKLTPEGVANVVKNVYKSGDRSLLTKFTKEEAATVYTKLVNPQVTAAIKAQNDQGLWDTYVQWTVDNAAASISRQAVNTMMGEIRDKDSSAKIEFDGKQFVLSTNAFVYKDGKFNRTGSGVGGDVQSVQAAAALAGDVDRINGVLRSATEVLKAGGADDAGASMLLFRKLGIDPAAEKEPTFMDRMKDGLIKWWDKDNVKPATPGKQSDASTGGASKEDNPFGGSAGASLAKSVVATAEGTPERVSLATGFAPTENTQASDAAKAIERATSPAGKGFVDWTQVGTDKAKMVTSELRKPLEETAEALGFPLIIRSGHRDTRHNRRVGGAPGSEHVTGNAVDLDLRGLSDEQRKDLVKELVLRGVNRLGAYSGNTGLHVDMKDQRHPDGSPWAMFNRSARNMGSAPSWFKQGLKEGIEARNADLGRGASADPGFFESPRLDKPTLDQELSYGGKPQVSEFTTKTRQEYQKSLENLGTFEEYFGKHVQKLKAKHPDSDWDSYFRNNPEHVEQMKRSWEADYNFYNDMVKSWNGSEAEERSLAERRAIAKRWERERKHIFPEFRNPHFDEKLENPPKDLTPLYNDPESRENMRRFWNIKKHNREEI